MMLTNSELFERISLFDIDGGPVKFTFAQKLARENGWTATFTGSVIDEYRKFLYLAMVAGHPVSPSDTVDQAWHVHMLYTYSYWERLTKEVLPRPLHHGPSKGGRAETAKFDDWYARTLDSYRREFGTEPPSNVWSPVGLQFANAEHVRRVNTKDHWVVPKAKVKRSAIGFASLLAAGLLVVGCTTVLPFAQVEALPILGVSLIGGGVLLIALVTALVRRGRSGTDNTNGGSSFGCSTMGTHTSVTHLGDGSAHSTHDTGSTGGDASYGHGAVAGADIGGSMGAHAGGGHDGGGGHGDGGSGHGDGGGSSDSSGGDSGGSGCGSSCGGGGCGGG